MKLRHLFLFNIQLCVFTQSVSRYTRLIRNEDLGHITKNLLCSQRNLFFKVFFHFTYRERGIFTYLPQPMSVLLLLGMSLGEWRLFIYDLKYLIVRLCVRENLCFHQLTLYCVDTASSRNIQGSTTYISQLLCLGGQFHIKCRYSIRQVEYSA
jgi:hypothetical protein